MLRSSLWRSPYLTALRVTASSRKPTVQKLRTMLPYVVRHAHGPQDTSPLQSMTVEGRRSRFDILAWPSFDINDADRDTTLHERVAFSVTCTDWSSNVLDDLAKILNAAVTALPLDSLVTFTSRSNARFGVNTEFWRRQEPRWPLLKHFHLG